MLAQQSAQHVPDQVFVAARDRALAQGAIEVAVAGARALPIGLGVGDRQEGDVAAADGDLSRPAPGDRAMDGFRPAGLFAVHRSAQAEFRPALQSGKPYGLDPRYVPAW